MIAPLDLAALLDVLLHSSAVLAAVFAVSGVLVGLCINVFDTAAHAFGERLADRVDAVRFADYRERAREGVPK